MNGVDQIVMAKLNAEIHQAPETRQELIEQLETHFKRRIVSFFMSFTWPVQLTDLDVDALEGILNKTNLDDGLALLINSPGGSGMAAERIIRICRTYGRGEFEVIVPKAAKSAATMICLGASRIYMSETAELGPIAPQHWLKDPETGEPIGVQAHNVIKTYEELVRKAVRTKGKPDAFLQQLMRYDPRIIEELRDGVALGEDIAISALSSGMMKGSQRRTIRRRLEPLLNPKVTSAHGRAVYPERAKTECKLNVSVIETSDAIWETLHELYVRTDRYVGTEASKAIETTEHAFYAPPVRESSDG